VETSASVGRFCPRYVIGRRSVIRCRRVAVAAAVAAGNARRVSVLSGIDVGLSPPASLLCFVLRRCHHRSVY